MYVDGQDIATNLIGQDRIRIRLTADGLGIFREADLVVVQFGHRDHLLAGVRRVQPFGVRGAEAADDRAEAAVIASVGYAHRTYRYTRAVVYARSFTEVAVHQFLVLRIQIVRNVNASQRHCVRRRTERRNFVLYQYIQPADVLVVLNHFGRAVAERHRNSVAGNAVAVAVVPYAQFDANRRVHVAAGDVHIRTPRRVEIRYVFASLRIQRILAANLDADRAAVVGAAFVDVLSVYPGITLAADGDVQIVVAYCDRFYQILYAERKVGNRGVTAAVFSYITDHVATQRDVREETVRRRVDIVIRVGGAFRNDVGFSRRAVRRTKIGYFYCRYREAGRAVERTGGDRHDVRLAVPVIVKRRQHDLRTGEVAHFDDLVVEEAAARLAPVDHRPLTQYFVRALANYDRRLVDIRRAQVAVRLVQVVYPECRLDERIARQARRRMAVGVYRVPFVAFHDRGERRQDQVKQRRAAETDLLRAAGRVACYVFYFIRTVDHDRAAVACFRQFVRDINDRSGAVVDRRSQTRQGVAVVVVVDVVHIRAQQVERQGFGRRSQAVDLAAVVGEYVPGVVARRVGRPA